MLQHPTDRIFPVNKLEEEKGSPENSIYLKQPVKQANPDTLVGILFL